MELACVYLARAQEGFEPIKAFLASYDKHDAGAKHTLVVLYKGWDESGLKAAQTLFADHPHRAITVPDEGFDIGPYLQAARSLDFEYMCFFNTFSQIEADGWLDKLVSVGSRPGIGMVSATGSFESHRDTALFHDRLHFTYHYCSLQPGYQQVRAVYEDYIDRNRSSFLRRHVLLRYKRFSRGVRYAMGRTADRETFVRRLREARGSRVWTLDFDPFPNAHLRTNAFLAKTSLLAGLDVVAPQTKEEAYAFESGANGLSARLAGAGLSLLIVGNDGIGYEPADWPHSGTFRSLGQSNLLVSDNQTRAFAAMTPMSQAAIQLLTWGQAMTPPLPEGFPTFGMPFSVEGLGGFHGAPAKGEPLIMNSA